MSMCNKPEDTTTVIFQQYKTLLFSIAYRMLGSCSDAEDMVQETFVRWLQAQQDRVESPKAYLSTVVVRLCIDHSRLARTQREIYVGPWLPEPLSDSLYPELFESVIQDESLSYAFLVMLEKLGPLERAVFLLRDIFDYEYADIAKMVEKSEANCRQVLRRARQHLGQQRLRFAVSREQQEQLTQQFLRASIEGDMQGLLHLLTDDIVFTGDSNGTGPQARKPVIGPTRVTRGMFGGMRFIPPDSQVRIINLNGQPAIMIYTPQGIYGVILFEIQDNRIRNIYSIINPAKLQRLMPNAHDSTPRLKE
ncbi:DNA-directed RNA polymerase sigma-70 factor [Dictyobacter alpinus]|uniref:DNA-directed RNA polymerase sigma-70 factor n=1 Tax=Dictyobacter alpinus TaxID=2014873 RepID=A0A402BC37_9CHLR|nr:RNA polymerase sigma-70 factor [Dictyobacter alpinus]GCE28886.1 DNA-directed RNA polymerase sigma-70 factor [Dictyobacter alpinus]